MKPFIIKIFLLSLCVLCASVNVAANEVAWREANEITKHTRPAEAAQALNRWISANNDAGSAIDGEAYFRLMQLYFKMGKTEQAKKILKDFNTVKPKLAPEALAWLSLCEANLSTVSQDAKAAKHHLDAIHLNAPEITSAIKANYYLLSAQQRSISNLYDEAIAGLNEANQWAEQTNDTHVLLGALSLQVNIQYYMEQYHDALSTNEQLVALTEQYSDDFYRMLAYSNAMNTYYMLSTKQEELEVNAESESIRDAAQAQKKEYIKKSDEYRSNILSQADAIGAFKPLLRAMIQIQNQHLRNAENQKAIDSARKTIAIAEKYQSDYEKAVSFNNMSIAYRSLSKFNDALNALKEADKIYTQLQHKQSMLWALEDYSIIYEKMGDYKKALEHYKKLYNDSMELTRTTNSEKVLELQKIYESERKQREIDQLNQKNLLNHSELKAQRTIITLTAFLAGIIAIGLFFLYNRNKAIAAANTKLDELNGRLKQQALRDPLTNLHNRRFIGEMQDKLVSTVMRRKNHDEQKNKIGLVLLDIDHFKMINDQYGHDVGDQVLIRVSNDLVKNLRDGDIAARWGGEEFLVILFDTNIEGVRAFCDRILALRSSSPIQLAETTGKVTMSMGYTLIPLGEDSRGNLSWNESVKLIDKLLYIAKDNGRNQAVSLTLARAELSTETKQLLLNSDKHVDYELLKEHGVLLEFLHPES